MCIRDRLNTAGACWLIKMCRPYRIVFTKICQMKSCQKWNVHFCSFETQNLWWLETRWTTNLHKLCLHNICSLVGDSALALSNFFLNLKLYLENRPLNKPSSEKWSSECTTFEWEANWWKISNLKMTFGLEVGYSLPEVQTVNYFSLHPVKA